MNVADKISQRLHEHELTTYNYSKSTQSGAWVLNQLRALEACEVAIFLLTPDSVASDACKDEALRAANPSRSACVVIPVVIGSWNFRASDHWVLLNKFNAILALDGLTDDHLDRLVDMTAASLERTGASLSTGHALEAVKNDLCRYLGKVDPSSADEVKQEAWRLQHKYRGSMVSFLQFCHLDRELRAAELIADPRQRAAYLISYLEGFFERIVSRALADTAAQLASRLQANDTVVISEYSRVILRALQVLSGSRPDVFRSLRFFIVSRKGMLLVDAEPGKMSEGILQLGGVPTTISFASWINYLRGGEDVGNLGRVNKLLFGVEAFSPRGDVVYPQIVSELDILRTRKTLGGRLADTEIIAAGESFKVCRDDHELSQIIADPHHTVMPAAIFDRIVTDLRQIKGSSSSVDLTDLVEHVKGLANELRQKEWPKDTPLPVWNLPTQLRTHSQTLATDIDGTLTVGKNIPSTVVDRIVTLADLGVRVVLVTGRSAGWASALALYVPGLAAVVAENGAVAIDPRTQDAIPLRLDRFDDAALARKLTELDECLLTLKTEYPFLQLSSDNYSRLTDRAVSVDARIDPERVRLVAADYGLRHTFSSVHHHISTSEMNKATGLILTMQQLFGLNLPELRDSSITIGDGFNDGPLFDSDLFAASVGVRGVLPHLEHLGTNRPDFVTLAQEGEGFLELTELVVGGRSRLGSS